MAPKFIIDTDAGVDDAGALMVALDAHKRGEIELCAITCVTGNTGVKNVLVNVFRVLDVMGCPDIPVYEGAFEGLVHVYGEERDGYFHGKDGFNDIPFESTPDANGRVQKGVFSADAIRSIIGRNPGDVTLVTLGPLTNLALAFKCDRHLPGKIKKLVIMGGNTEGVGNTTLAAEFNFHADPESAYVVLEMADCPTFIVAWELCSRYTNVSMEWRNSVLGKLGTAASDLINRLEEPWSQSRHYKINYCMCDQLAVIVGLEENSIKVQTSHKVTVELSGRVTRGLMVLDRRTDVDTGKNNAVVVDRMDEDIIKERLIRAFKNC